MKKIKKILFAATLNPLHDHHVLYEPLKRIAEDVIIFDTSWLFYNNGKDRVNEMFLELVKKEQPDWLFLTFGSYRLTLESLYKIREISPKTITFRIFPDDDSQFDSFSRYFILFVDYGLINQGEKYVKLYKKENIYNVFSNLAQMDKFLHRPLNEKKIYDLVFIGSNDQDSRDRYEILKYLIDNNIKLRIFGKGWEQFPELKNNYEGFLEEEKKVKIFNRAKISLVLSKNWLGIPQLKGKFFEAAACKTFTLTEYCKDYLDYFKDGKDIIMFQDKEDLLKKINYYLNNNQEREKIAKQTYKKVIKNYNFDSILDRISEKLKKNNQIIHNSLPKSNKKIISINEKEIFQEKEELLKKLKDIDYIILKKGDSENLRFREELQAYSLDITNRPISCCDYYVYDKKLGDYLLFYVERGFKLIDKKSFINFLNLNQIMIRKDYLIENIDKIRKIYNGSKIDFINKENTSFISFPLVRIIKAPRGKFEDMNLVFDLTFIYTLFSLRNNKKLLFKYILFLIYHIIKGETFILTTILRSISDTRKKNALKAYNGDYKLNN